MPLPRTVSILLLASVTMLAGCTLVSLRSDTRAYEGDAVLVGRVSGPPGWQGPVRVVALAQQGGERQVAHQVLLHEPGGFELIVPAGRYTLAAWGDTGGDGRPGNDAPAAMRADEVQAPDSGMVFQLDMLLQPGTAAAVRAALPGRLPAPVTHDTQAGALLVPGAPDFSAEAAHLGYWTPREAFRRLGGNIYFAEPYDPARTPVLFVHGALGSAADWQAFIAGLDRQRYQAWVYQYPSGAPLESMAHLLYWKLMNLRLRHGFERLHLVGHSMGGLVLRRFLVDHGQEFQPQLGAFVTLSTPWGGEEAATLGVQHAPAVVPSWRDMQPGGPFLATLFQRPLPAGLPYTLLFGHRGGYSLLRPNHDGTVTLASQLRPEAQQQARLVLGFDEDHGSILQAPAVIAQVHRVLLAADTPRNATEAGRVRVMLRTPGGEAPPLGAAPVLVLLPVPGQEGPPGAPLTLPIPVGATGPFGPIPPGRYDAAIAAISYRAPAGRQRVEVSNGQVAALAFDLAPEGSLQGQIGAAGTTARQPAGTRPMPGPVRVERLVLRGPGGTRVLVPRRGDESDLLTAYLDGRDEAIGSYFSFLGLAEGEYTLTIEASGHLPHVSRHRVQPGVATPLAPLLLTPRP
jgi:pimeloyl-ACP methyl ester carboxylesterase